MGQYSHFQIILANGQSRSFIHFYLPCSLRLSLQKWTKISSLFGTYYRSPFIISSLFHESAITSDLSSPFAPPIFILALSDYVLEAGGNPGLYSLVFVEHFPIFWHVLFYLYYLGRNSNLFFFFLFYHFFLLFSGSFSQFFMHIKLLSCVFHLFYLFWALLYSLSIFLNCTFYQFSVHVSFYHQFFIFNLLFTVLYYLYFYSQHNNIFVMQEVTRMLNLYN